MGLLIHKLKGFHLVSKCQKEFFHVSHSLLLERWMGWNIDIIIWTVFNTKLDVAKSAYVLCTHGMSGYQYNTTHLERIAVI